MSETKLEAIIQAVEFLNSDDCDSARQVINTKYKFQATKAVERRYTTKQMMKQFFKDGFVDRYSGRYLINPGILRIISEEIPESFPYHLHWKTDKCHIAYWEYQPTVDHIYPVSLGGRDGEENWATTSMVNNLSKSNFTLEQLGWDLKNRGDLNEWDGLSKIFIDMIEHNQSYLKTKRIKEWYVATKEVMQKEKLL